MPLEQCMGLIHLARLRLSDVEEREMAVMSLWVPDKSKRAFFCAFSPLRAKCIEELFSCSFRPAEVKTFAAPESSYNSL